jgi:hypothetical protein
MFSLSLLTRWWFDGVGGRTEEKKEERRKKKEERRKKKEERRKKKEETPYTIQTSLFASLLCLLLQVDSANLRSWGLIKGLAEL